MYSQSAHDLVKTAEAMLDGARAILWNGLNYDSICVKEEEALNEIDSALINLDSALDLFEKVSEDD